MLTQLLLCACALRARPPSIRPGTGVRPSNLRDAASFDEVQRQVAELLRGRILVGHAIDNDLEVRPRGGSMCADGFAPRGCVRRAASCLHHLLHAEAVMAR